MTRDAAMAHLDTYLDQVRRRLHALPSGEVEEILRELRSHVLDRVQGVLTPNTVEAALSALGSPAEVARANVTERALVVLDKGPAPLRVLRALWRLATVSVLGAVTFFVGLFGYAFAAGLLIVAAWKPFDPDRVGAWHTAPGGWVIGTIDHTPASQELLGWWLIPVAVVAGLSLGYLTWRATALIVRLMARGDRRARAGVEFA